MLLGVLLIVVAVVAVLVGRGTLSLPGAAGLPGGGTVPVRAIVGSEKRGFFEDEEVRAILAGHGFEVSVDTAGSRQIATGTDLGDYDLAFPSSAPAADKIAESTVVTARYTPFHSPIAVATFRPILDLLAEHGIARQEAGVWHLDMAGFLELVRTDTRWRDLGPEYPSARAVQFSTSDVRSSNSAAMYLAILAWVANDDAVVSSPEQVAQVLAEVSPLFIGQGYTEGSSAGPFGDYLAQGMGAKPMVIVYEAQYLAEEQRGSGRIQPDMALAYPQPTVLSNHTALGLSEAGGEVARLLAEDPQLQARALAHGFRPQDPSAIPAGTPVPGFLDTVDPPDYELLETLIEGVSASYTTTPTEEDLP